MYHEIYNAGYPILSVGHALSQCENIDHWPDFEEETRALLKEFVFEKCKAQPNWNMPNFIENQITAIKNQVGDKKVLLALSGGVDSSVVAALLIKAIGKQLVCVHVNHGLMRKGESQMVIDVFKKQMDANLSMSMQANVS